MRTCISTLGVVLPTLVLAAMAVVTPVSAQEATPAAKANGGVGPTWVIEEFITPNGKAMDLPKAAPNGDAYINVQGVIYLVKNGTMKWVPVFLNGGETFIAANRHGDMVAMSGHSAVGIPFAGKRTFAPQSGVPTDIANTGNVGINLANGQAAVWNFRTPQLLNFLTTPIGMDGAEINQISGNGQFASGAGVSTGYIKGAIWKISSNGNTLIDCPGIPGAVNSKGTFTGWDSGGVFLASLKNGKYGAPQYLFPKGYGLDISEFDDVVGMMSMPTSTDINHTAAVLCQGGETILLENVVMPKAPQGASAGGMMLYLDVANNISGDGHTIFAQGKDGMNNTHFYRLTYAGK